MRTFEVVELLSLSAALFLVVGWLGFADAAVARSPLDSAKVRKEREVEWVDDHPESSKQIEAPWNMQEVINEMRRQQLANDLEERLLAAKRALGRKRAFKGSKREEVEGGRQIREGSYHKCTTDPWCLY